MRAVRLRSERARPARSETPYLAGLRGATYPRAIGEARDPDQPVPVIHGERVVLRPFKMDELDAWLDARTEAAADRSVAPGGPPDPDRLRERAERSGRMRDHSLDLVIESDGRLVGEIGTFADPEAAVQPGVFLLAIGLFAPSDRGRGLGSEAVRLLCDWLFRSAGADRVESSTATSNTAMRRVLEKVGFDFVGVYRRWEVDWAHYTVSRGVGTKPPPVVNS
jgi:RimJ/RimL family protein N-acetyltransferase